MVHEQYKPPAVYAATAETIYLLYSTRRYITRCGEASDLVVVYYILARSSNHGNDGACTVAYSTNHLLLLQL